MSLRRGVPRLSLHVELEGTPRADLTASYEELQRLRLWLRQTSALEGIPAVMAAILDELDEQDRAHDERRPRRAA